MKTYQDPELADVRAFNMKFGMLVNDRPVHLSDRKMTERLNFIREEFDELIEAHDFGRLADMFDAMLDLVYVIKGTALMMGLPWEEGWAEVQRANMAKEPGVTKRGNLVDAMKPPGWQPPDHESVLAMYGYDSGEWLTEPGDMGERDLLPGMGVDDAPYLIEVQVSQVPVCTCETLEDGTVVQDGLCPKVHEMRMDP